MLTTSIIAVASLLLSYFPLPEKVEYSLAELSIAKKATFVYSIGQIEIHKPGGTVVPLQLMKSFDNKVVMMVTEPFNVSSTDSIYFRRTLTMSSAGSKKAEEKTVAANKFEKVYLNLEASSMKAGVKLHDTLFNKESYIQYIVDVMYDRDTAILASLDTITVKRSSSGYLKAYTAAFRPESVTKALQNVDPNRPVIVRVWIQSLLPQQSKYTMKTKAMLRDKKAYNVITTNGNMIVPGYARRKN